MEQKQELRGYFDRASKYLPELFNTAHAVTGNYNVAEYAVQCALKDAWEKRSRSGTGLRDDLREAMMAIALQEAANRNAEMTWELEHTESDSPVAQTLGQESTDVRRAAVLRYGCGLSYGKIAGLVGLTESNVRDVLERFENRLRRGLRNGENHRVESMIGDWMAEVLRQTDRTMPALNVLYRSFESEMSQYEQEKPGKRHVSRVFGALIALLLAVICVVVFWLMSVLTQSTEPENYNGSTTETQSAQEQIG